MQAIVFGGQRQISLSQAPWPQPAAGEVLLRVLRTALCGSDTKLWQRGAEHTPGHEIFGVVDQPGHALHGRRCCVFMPVHCGHCASCARGDTHLCLSESTLLGWNRPGGYAQALAVPEQCLMPVPDDIDDDLAPLLLDTIGTAAHGLRTVQPLLPGAQADLLITGAGPVGLGALVAAQELGWRQIWVSDPRPGRLARAGRRRGAAAGGPHRAVRQRHQAVAARGRAHPRP